MSWKLPALGVVLVALVGWTWHADSTPPLLSMPSVERPDMARDAFSEQASVDWAAADQQPFLEPHQTTEVAADVSERRRQQVRQLIRRLRPHASESSVEVWVDEFAASADDEIEFLMTQASDVPALSQLAQISGEFAEVPVWQAAASDSAGPSSAGVEAANERVRQTARQNLRHQRTVGYRDQIPLTQLTADDPASSSMASVYRLSCGEVLQTWNALHVALQVTGPVFFQLEDGRLTRNGMFVHMPDGRIGLQAGNHFVAIRDSPVIPAGSECHVDSGGRILVAGQDAPVGVIPVVSATSVADLSTSDGVYFRGAQGCTDVTSALLQPGAVELSNVDREFNRGLLDSESVHAVR